MALSVNPSALGGTVGGVGDEMGDEKGDEKQADIGADIESPLGDNPRPVHHVYPVGLVVEGRRCVIVGGGRIATRRLTALLDAGADIQVIAPDASPEMASMAERGLITWHRRGFAPQDLDGVWLVLSATGNLQVDQEVARCATERRVWVASADDPSASTASIPTVLRRGDLLLTLSTGGRSPALAAWLKDRLSEEFGPEYETLLDVMAEIREEQKALGLPTESLDWRRALDSGILEDVRMGRIDAAKEAFRACR
ncbi:siroheme synthase, N-terminal domain [Actinobacteria bacterium IMCC26256]|nr:siroheme synthase, N-terminal domain [Actinobacteria bacterium IMCC26256]